MLLCFFSFSSRIGQKRNTVNFLCNLLHLAFFFMKNHPSKKINPLYFDKAKNHNITSLFSLFFISLTFLSSYYLFYYTFILKFSAFFHLWCAILSYHMHISFMCALRVHQQINITEKSSKNCVYTFNSIIPTCKILTLNSLYLRCNKKNRI